MKSVRRWCIASALLSGLWMGCSGGGDSGMDATADGGGMDVQTQDASDARPNDAGRDAPAMSDPCAAGAIIDLTGMAPGSDGVLHYMGNSEGTGLRGGLPTPEMCVAPAMKGGMNFVGHQVAFRYRMRTNAALRVSTANPGTTMNFDTVVFLTTTCSASGMALACNDDSEMGVLQSTAQTNSVLAMGTEVVIIVGGYSPPYNAENVNYGSFELTVVEVPPVPVGMSCTEFDVCATGSHCLPTIADPMMRTCQQDGTRGALCRDADPRCDTGLTCSAASAMDAGICREQVSMAGAMCDATGRTNFCAAPMVCGRTSATMAVCRATVPESETPSNNMPAMPQTPVTVSTSFQGALMPANDVDCYGVTLAMPSSLVVTTSDGAGFCPPNADTIVRVYNTMSGMMIAEDDDSGPGLCSALDGTTMGPLHNLAAGTYSVCVSSYGMMPMEVSRYILDVAIVPGS